MNGHTTNTTRDFWFLVRAVCSTLAVTAFTWGAMLGSPPLLRPEQAPAVGGQSSNKRSNGLPRVHVLATGGTIAGQGASSTSVTEYKRGAYLGEELIARVPELKQFATITVEQITNVYGSDITLANWLTLAKRINAVFAADPSLAGIVITHGTNTLEETAYFLNLTVKDARPVVVVGAQRPGTAVGADGPSNLIAAVRTAIAADARNKGVLVVLNDEINSAREVTKANTYRPGTFRTPELGFLGYVDSDRVTFYRDTTRRHTLASEFDVSGLKELPSVDVLYSYIEPSIAPFRALLASGVKGIVFAGSGPGGLSSFERSAVAEANARPPDVRPIIVRASRTGSGRVVSGGSEYRNLITVTGDNLNPQKARILLMLGLTKTADPAEIQRMFSEY
jgi:L-asparaginase